MTSSHTLSGPLVGSTYIHNPEPYTDPSLTRGGLKVKGFWDLGSHDSGRKTSGLESGGSRRGPLMAYVAS